MQVKEERAGERSYEPPRLRELGTLRELTRHHHHHHHGNNGGGMGSVGGGELGPSHDK
jgi:hypothetical protein